MRAARSEQLHTALCLVMESCNTANGHAAPTAGELSSTLDQLSIFDPDLFPTLLPRIHELMTLIIEASKDVNSLAQPDTETSGAAPAQTLPGLALASATAPAPPGQQSTSSLPSFVLGATSEEEMTNTWDDYAFQQTVKRSVARPTELQKKIVREAQILRETLSNARLAVEQLSGGGLSLKRQREVIEMLEKQEIRQKELEASFVARSAFPTPSDMDTS
ncbi:hypothetical protein K437DRAFT_271620 [Tilletiaria anomala UBC 951]|uniref:Mediator of RNA polymerase II transcription subunit 9 n=1 Tax=Tilletiaria anomala (strain ATCC 24038 / CBS 436.72 / UBC 951) TaxID=1037660 RepID=A0A066WRW3_TILAU|nr:uncharacterized protein K437DRAFT_271620 [Tilletiaria anomala UBC 951]KDN53390.1 hypothetical protein K437DRAFT_271620 [Tilletiaria anomala UBC 951]